MRASFLFGLFLLAVATFGAHWYVGATHRHVGVEASNVDDVVRVDVNCRRALTLEAGEGSKEADLGWLEPGDRIYISDYNKRGAAAWTVTLTIDGVKHTFSSGHAGVTGQVAEPYGVAFAVLVTADGDRIGSIGCDPPALVSDSVAGYQRSPDAVAVLERQEVAPLWDSPRFPFALIEAATGLLPVFAAVGWAAAIFSARVRRLIREHRLADVLVTLFGLFLSLTNSSGLQVLVVWFVIVGLILLLVSAVVTVWPHTGSWCLTSCSTPAPKPNPE